MKPLAIELYAGLHGWGEGGIAEGFRVRGYDIVDMCAELGLKRPEGIDLILRDVRSIHGSELKDAAVIVASPPCQAYSYRAMPWKRAKALPPPDNTLFDACFRIQREASEAAGRYIPLIVENVRGAQKWVGRARWHFGSYYLWGDVPALMPITLQLKMGWDNSVRGKCRRDDQKVVGHINIRDGQAEHVKAAAARIDEFGTKGGGDWFGSGKDCSLQRRFSGTKQSGISGPRNNGKGYKWFQDGAATFGSKSNSRKAASALIAKIPFPLAQHIARCFKPVLEDAS